MKVTDEERKWLDLWARTWTHDTRVQELMKISAGRILTKECRRRTAWKLDSLLVAHTPSVSHIVDWLSAAILNGDDWLDNVDELSRPRKLMKCGSIQQLLHEADKAMKKRLQGMTSAPVDDRHERKVVDLADGYSVIRLLTPEALDRESVHMQHCVGHGSYDWRVANGASEIYSLRDPAGKPHATIEVSAFGQRYTRNGLTPGDKKFVQQIQGKQNDRPTRRYLDLLKPWLKGAGWQGLHRWWPTVTDIHGVEHEIDAVPPGTVFKDLELAGFRSGSRSALSIMSLPENVRVEGNLRLMRVHSIHSTEHLQRLSTTKVGGKVISDFPPEAFPEHLRDKVEKPVQFLDTFRDGLWQVGRGLAEAWEALQPARERALHMFLDEVDEVDFNLNAQRRDECRIVMDWDRRPQIVREINRQDPRPDLHLRGTRTLLGEGLPAVPEADDEPRQARRHPRERHGRRTRRKAAPVPAPHLPDFDSFMAVGQALAEPEPKVQVLDLPFKPQPVIFEPGAAPVAADYYPRRPARKATTNAQQVDFQSLVREHTANIARGLGLSWEQVVVDAVYGRAA